MSRQVQELVIISNICGKFGEKIVHLQNCTTFCHFSIVSSDLLQWSISSYFS